MDFEFDPAKDESNIEKHGLSLADADGFKWESAVVRENTREQYAEPRFEAKGYIGDRLHVMVFCLRGGSGILNSPISGNSATLTRARGPRMQDEHEQKTSQEPLADLQG